MNLGSHPRSPIRSLAVLIAALALLAAPAAAQAGTLASSPTGSFYNTQPYFFGQQFNNFQVSNTGTATAVGNASITGPDAARFSFSGDGCSGLILADTHFCHVDIVFSPPNGPGSFSAQVEIPSDDPASPLVIPLSVQVLAGADLVSTPHRVDFGVTALGGSRSQQITITNAGDFAGGVQQAFIVGPAEFTIENDQCAQQQLNPGQSCTLAARFTPSSVEDFQGSVFAISGNTPEPVLPVNLSGQGRLATGLPGARITRRPPKSTHSKIASFQFSADGIGLSIEGFECKLDNEAFAPCSSPSTYRVKRGRHSFQVRVGALNGAAQGAPTTASWKVKRNHKK